MVDNDKQQGAWQYRLDCFLEHHDDQLCEPKAKLVFGIRSEDNGTEVKQYLSSQGISASVDIKLGEKISAGNGELNKQAVKAIFDRAKKVLTHNQNPPHLRRGQDVKCLGLRMADRLTGIPERGEILEDALVRMAGEMKSLYCVSGAYGPAQSRPFPNLFEYLKNEFNSYDWNIPFPIIEALFKNKKYELKIIFDGIHEQKCPAPKSFTDLKVGDPLVIVAYRKKEDVGGYEPYEGTGFKITDHSDVLPLILASDPLTISGREPLVCVRPLSGLETKVEQNRYEIRTTAKGKLYVADFARYSGKTWAAVGSWDNKTKNIPDDTTAYQIFKPFERLNSRMDYEGSGLGLAICQRIVINHGGSLTAESTPRKGSRFIFCLPISR